MDKRITDAELDVMEVLWGADEPLTAADIADHIDPTRAWTLATVKTMLSRLAAKGRNFLPRRGPPLPLLAGHRARILVSVQESRRFVDKLFGGRLSPLVARLAEEDSLDEEDIAADRGDPEGAQVMTSWLLGTLIATSVLICYGAPGRASRCAASFGSRIAYGLWLVPAARLLMPTLTQTVERTVPASAPVQPLIQPVAGEPMMLAQAGASRPRAARADRRLADGPADRGSGSRRACSLSRTIAFHRDRRAISSRRGGDAHALRLDPHRPVDQGRSSPDRLRLASSTR